MGKIRSSLSDLDDALLAIESTLKTARRAYLSALNQAMKKDGVSDQVGNPPWWQRGL